MREELVCHRRMRGGNPKGLYSTSDKDSDSNDEYEEYSDGYDEHKDEEENEIEYLHEDEIDDEEIDVEETRKADEANWNIFMDANDRMLVYNNYVDYKNFDYYRKKFREELTPRILVWWNSFNHDIEYEDFDDCLNEVVYDYMEKDEFRFMGIVDNQKE
jgi:hypothetical protein